MSTLTSPPASVAGQRAGARLRHWAPLAVVLAGTFMAVLDFFIVNVALPSIQHSLHASPGSIEWIGAGYALTSAVLLIAGGRLGDRLGRQRMFCVGLVVFTAGSAVCGIAPHASILIVGRLTQGLGGALLTTNVLSLMGILYTGGERQTAMAAYATVMGVAAVGGQLLGGALVQLDPFGLSWRSCFLINLPIGLAALVAARRFVPESRGEVATGLDTRGVALVTVGLTAIVLPLVEGRQLGWPAWTWVSLGLAPVVLACFIAQQRRLARTGGTPLLELSLFAERSFQAGLLAQAVFWCGQASFFLILALYLQQGRGLGPLASGAVFSALALPYVITSLRAPMLAARHGRSVVTASAMTLVVGHLLLIGTLALIGTGGSVLALLPGLVVVGAGMGLGIGPLTGGLLATLRAEHAGAASGVLATAQFVGSAIGVGLVGIAFFDSVHSGYGTAMQHGLAVLVVALTVVALLSRQLPKARPR